MLAFAAARLAPGVNPVRQTRAHRLEKAQKMRGATS